MHIGRMKAWQNQYEKTENVPFSCTIEKKAVILQPQKNK